MNGTSTANNAEYYLRQLDIRCCNLPIPPRRDFGARLQALAQLSGKWTAERTAGLTAKRFGGLLQRRCYPPLSRPSLGIQVAQISPKDSTSNGGRPVQPRIVLFTVIAATSTKTAKQVHAHSGCTYGACAAADERPRQFAGRRSSVHNVSNTLPDGDSALRSKFTRDPPSSSAWQGRALSAREQYCPMNWVLQFRAGGAALGKGVGHGSANWEEMGAGFWLNCGTATSRWMAWL